MNKPAGIRTGFILIAVAQAGIVISILLSFSFFGMDFFPLAVIVVLSLLLVNAGLASLYFSFFAYKESSRRMRLLAEMNVQVNREILLNEDIELIYRTILDYLFSIFDTAKMGSVLVLGEDGYLSFASSRGFTEDYVQKFRLKLEDSFLYQETRGSIRETRLITHETFERIFTKFQPGDWEYQSVISSPLFIGDRLFGILNLDSDKPGSFNDEDVRIVERFRAQIEVGLLARERYRSSIERYHVDSLTGLFSRRYFEDLFSVIRDRAYRYNENLVVALFDADGLKYVNDTFGHLAGDQMLMLIAKAIRASCRKSDIIGRFGGDEFIAAYHVSETEVIEKNIASILSSFRAKPVRFGDKEHRLSFSYGLARFPEDGTDLDALTEAADKKLYAMKSEHKSRLASSGR